MGSRYPARLSTLAGGACGFKCRNLQRVSPNCHECERASRRNVCALTAFGPPSVPILIGPIGQRRASRPAASPAVAIPPPCPPAQQPGAQARPWLGDGGGHRQAASQGRGGRQRRPPWRGTPGAANREAAAPAVVPSMQAADSTLTLPQPCALLGAPARPLLGRCGPHPRHPRRANCQPTKLPNTGRLAAPGGSLRERRDTTPTPELASAIQMASGAPGAGGTERNYGIVTELQLTVVNEIGPLAV